MSQTTGTEIEILRYEWKCLSRHQQYRLRLMTIYTGYMKAFAAQYATDVFIARDGIRYAGWAALDNHTNRFMIYIMPKHRSRGIGRRMLDMAFEFTGKPLTVYPWSVESNNLFKSDDSRCIVADIDTIADMCPSFSPRIQNMGKSQW